MKNEYEIQQMVERLANLFPEGTAQSLKAAREHLVEFWQKAKGVGYDQGYDEAKKQQDFDYD